MSNLHFQTKDLVVTSANIQLCHEVSGIRYFVDFRNGKGIVSSNNLDEAIGFAKEYQSQLN